MTDNIRTAIKKIRLTAVLSQLTDDELGQVEERASTARRVRTRQRQATQRITVQRGRVWTVIDQAPIGTPIVLGDTQGRKWRVTREK